MNRFAVISLVLGLLAPPASAHFVLEAPANWLDQDIYGDPQKSPPCGLPDQGSATPVTTVVEGSTVTIAITETIFHPGHYRVSLAEDQSLLPPNPVVTPGSTACGSAAIDSSPSLPILADGLLVHSSPFGAMQTMEVQLPAGFTCTNCVLQIVEFMSEHPAPCFYYHCANLEIVSEGSGQPDAGGTPLDGGASDGGASALTPPEGGCGCGASGGVAQAALLMILLVVLRRSRRGEGGSR
jgi:hypothetical protein